MKEQMLERFKFPKKLKEELVGLVLYKGMDVKIIAERYGLPNPHILANWINLYKKKLEAGAITLALVKHWENRRKTHDSNTMAKG